MGGRFDRFPGSQVPGNVDPLFISKAFPNTCRKPFGAGHSDRAEGDFNRCQRWKRSTALTDAVKSGHRYIPGDEESFFFEASDKIIGLVICGADPCGDSITGLD